MKRQTNVSRLMRLAGAHRFLTYSSWVLSALSSLIALVPFIYIWMIVRDVLACGGDFSSLVSLPSYGWKAVAFAVLAIFVYTCGLMCSHFSAFRVATNIRVSLMNHIASLPLGVAERFGSGRLRKIVNESSAATETYLAHQLPDKAGAIATPLGLIALLVYFDWRLGLLSVVPVFLGFLIMMAMTGKGMERKMREYQNALDAMSNQAVEYVRGIPVVKTFGQSIFSFRKFKESIDNYGTWVIAYTKSLRMPMVGYTAAVNGVFVFLIVAALFMTRGGVSAEFTTDLVFYIIITPVISVTLTKIMYHSENAMIVADALSRIDSVLDMRPLAEVSPECAEHPMDSSVELKDVRFSYDGKTNVIKGVSLKIGAGEKIAFAGPSGGGKTTLANLMARFFDPQEGCVVVGGKDVRRIPKKELMETVSFVFQNSRLVKGTIFDNVRMGRPDASREEVMRALEAAQCADIIGKFPQRENTVIGSEGVFLSGGEQQRVAIARAILKNSPVIILDEATAFADPDNEAKVQAAFTELAKGKTVLMIAHRLSTIVNTDRIYVVQDGRVAEQGDFAALKDGGALFAKMWRDYQTSVKWKVVSAKDAAGRTAESPAENRERKQEG